MPSRRLRIIDLVRPHWKALTIALVAVLGETLTDILRAVAYQNRRRQHPAVEEAPAGARRDRDRAVRLERQRGAVLRRRRGRAHCGRRRGQLLRREVPDHERQPMGGTRPAADAVPPHSAAVSCRTRPVADRRPHHAGHQRHRRGPGLPQLGAPRDARQRDDAGRHDRSHALPQLALHPHRAVGRASALPGGVLLHAPHQEAPLGRFAPRRANCSPWSKKC